MKIGYHVLSEKPDRIIVGMDFSHLTKDSEPTLVYRNKRYKRGHIEYFDGYYADQFCSCREYLLIKEDKEENMDKKMHIIKNFKEWLKIKNSKEHDLMYLYVTSQYNNEYVNGNETMLSGILSDIEDGSYYYYEKEEPKPLSMEEIYNLYLRGAKFINLNGDLAYTPSRVRTTNTDAFVHCHDHVWISYETFLSRYDKYCLSDGIITPLTK